MNTLYIAGDSFATISKLQPELTSWSELLAKELGCDLQNVSRSAASNVSIAIQLDYILKECDSSDYIVVLLTDNYRKTFPNTDKDIDDAINSGKINLLSGHSLKDQQKNLSKVNFSTISYIITSTIMTPETKDYYKKYFNYNLQRFEDIYILTGIFYKILKKTKNLFVCSGGINNDHDNYKDNIDISDRNLFELKQENYIDLSQTQMIRFGLDKNSCNHLTLDAHAKVYRFIHNHINKTRQSL